ncbi:efflux RND transporter periplasmic adaptor subunit [Myxococcota bacterium]|nr:efflux RND transporter periplasmic adaptor subunit [Myxococcota bacterium]MBU1383180.1 efflux RND transporter periplasmic adaptor subunit [Myxococcota bacterium]MBU1497184.1 efflux RND transporter periplasmic adaptor subunit [Myxococcota bacterium]
MKPTSAVLFLFIVLSVFTVFSCNKESVEKQVKKKKGVPFVDFAVVKTTELTNSIDLFASVKPQRLAVISSPSQGPVLSLTVVEGDRVKKNDVLVTIGRQNADTAEAHSAWATYKREKTDMERLDRLAKAGAVAGEEVEKAKLRMVNAQAKLTAAAQKVADYRIGAPWDAVVLKVHTFAGSFVTPNLKLLELFDPASLAVQIPVPEEFCTLITDKTPIKLRFDAWPGKVFSGKLVRFHPDVDDKTKTRIMWTEVKEKIPLLPGMSVNVTIELERIKGTVVPSSAVFRLPDGRLRIFTVENSQIRVKFVKTGMEKGGLMIVYGLEEGTEVVTRGNLKLKDGKKVKVIKKQSGPENGMKKAGMPEQKENPVPLKKEPSGMKKSDMNHRK